MPKLKTNRSAAKRFRKTANGNYKHKSAFRNHILTSKSAKRKSHLAGNRIVNKSDNDRLDAMLTDY